MMPTFLYLCYRMPQEDLLSGSLGGRSLVDLPLLQLVRDRSRDEQRSVRTDHDTQQDRERKASDRATTQDEDTQYHHQGRQ